MFIVNFNGGIGNQMFQYSLYKAMVIKYPNVNIKMLISCFNHNGFELERVFDVERNECSSQEAAYLGEYISSDIKYSKVFNKLNYWRRLLFGYKNSYILQDNSASFYKEVFQLSPLNSYVLEGYWQNVQYFEDIQNEIIRDFQFALPLSDKNLDYQNIIQSTNSVSIHVRRGDYLKVGFPVLSLEYYKDAIKIIEERVDNPVYFIFSDDPEFIEENFKFLSNYKIINFNSGNSSYIDMQLMSMCKHNIIANSTFSFWGAFLNNNSKKVVVSPDKIIKQQHKNSFGCKDWIKLEIEKYSIHTK